MHRETLVNPVVFFAEEEPQALIHSRRWTDCLAAEIDEIERRAKDQGRHFVGGGKHGAYPRDIVAEVIGMDLEADTEEFIRH